MSRWEQRKRPPYSNTGVKNTKEKEGDLFDRTGFTCCIDWLQFTVNYDFTVNRVITEILGLSVEPFEVMEKAGNGYTGRLYDDCTGISISFNADRVDMGINVKLSGESIRRYVQLKGKEGCDKLLERIYRVNANVSRLDLALDDQTNKFYVLDSLKEQVESGNIVSYWETVETRFRQKLAHPEQFLEKSIYFGAMQSDVTMRVYDKKIEQLQKIKDKKSSEYQDVQAKPSWVRWEMVFRREYATQLLAEIVRSDFDFANVFFAALNYRFKIIQQTQINRSRCPLATLWEKFISTFEELRLVFAKPEKTIVKIMGWLESQVMPTLTGITELPDIGWQYVWQQIQYCRLHGNFKDFRNLSRYA